MGLVKNSLKTSALVWLLVAAAAPAIARDAGLVPDAPLMKPHRTFWDLAQFTWVLAEALTVADPAEDLILFSSSRRAQGYLSSPLAVAARLFVKNGALNLIVQESRMEVLGRYSPDSDLSKIEFGSRVRASKVALHSPMGLSQRSDWLVFNLDPLPVPAPPAAKAGEAPAHPDHERRLRELKHLLEEKLITDKEYQAKRAEILKSL